MKALLKYIWIIAVLVCTQLFIENPIITIPIWILAGFITKKTEMKLIYLKVFLIEAMFILTMIFIDRPYYLYLEEWMSNLGQNQYMAYIVIVLFNALNAAFCFLLGAAVVKPKKKKKYSGPYHF